MNRHAWRSLDERGRNASIAPRAGAELGKAWPGTDWGTVAGTAERPRARPTAGASLDRDRCPWLRPVEGSAAAMANPGTRLNASTQHGADPSLIALQFRCRPSTGFSWAAHSPRLFALTSNGSAVRRSAMRTPSRIPLTTVPCP